MQGSIDENNVGIRVIMADEGPKKQEAEPQKPMLTSDTGKEEPALDAPKAEAEEVPPPPPISVQRLIPKLKKSAKLFEEAKKYIPNGASSLVRVASYDPCPPFIKKGIGSHIWDEDDNEYIDFNMAYGVLINGHAHPDIVKAIQDISENGTQYGAPTALELEAAKAFKKMVPNTERLAFCINGSDATMNAIRIARAATGKDVILKFEGHYHGQHDYALISTEAPPMVAGLEAYPRPLPNSAGIPEGVTAYTMVAPFNSIPAVEKIVKRYKNRLAAIILEPVMANAGIIPPEKDYLKKLRQVATENELLLIFDEVLTGFRVAPGGAQQLYGVEPDLSCWAKALGSGVPVSAVSGKAEYMDLIAPGRISFGGTYFANNISMAGTLANLKVLQKGGTEMYERLGRLTEKMHKGIEAAAKEAKISVTVQSVCGMLQYYFTRKKKITNYREALAIDWDLYLRHSQLLLEKGMYTHPDNYERLLLSNAHTDKDVEQFINTIHETFAELKKIPREYMMETGGNAPMT
jgi:glutamate-1-semialdehyde 2,1-aminomutase